MNLVQDLLTRARRSRIAVAGSIAALGLLVSLTAPSIMTALGDLSSPVGCLSSPGDPSLVGDLSDVCFDGPLANDGDGGAAGDGDVNDDVIGATPTFTG